MNLNGTKIVVLATMIGCGPSTLAADDASGAPLRDAAVDASGSADTDRDAERDDSLVDDDADRVLVVRPAQFVDENLPLRMLADGDPIDLWAAPQGGHVVLVAAKVKNFQGDTAILRVRARYPDTPFIVAEEARSVKMVPVPGEPDTMQPDLRTRTQVAHVPLCPDYDPMDIVDRPMEFTLQISSATPGSNQSGDVTLRLRPTCVAGVSHPSTCRCECSANYFLGKCGRDGGSSDVAPSSVTPLRGTFW